MKNNSKYIPGAPSAAEKPTPVAPVLAPTREYFTGQMTSLESELASARLKVAHLEGALNLVRGQAALFFPPIGTAQPDAEPATSKP